MSGIWSLDNPKISPIIRHNDVSDLQIGVAHMLRRKSITKKIIGIRECAANIDCSMRPQSL
jgi:hypothetical protein